MSDAPSRARQRSPATPEMCEKLSAAAKARWGDPIAGPKWRAAVGEATRSFSLASRARLSEATKARWADPAARERLMVAIRAANANPVVRQRKATATQERWADPAMRERLMAGMTSSQPKRRRKSDNSDS